MIKRLTLIGALLATLLLLGACRPADAETADTAETSATEAPVAQQESLRRVRTIRADEGVLEATRSTSVSIDPLQESQVASRATGQVAAVVQREGALVEAGDTVIRLDDSDLQLQTRNAQLAAESARVNLQKAERATQEGVGQAQAGLRTAQVNRDLAERRYREGQQLFERGGISQTDLGGLEAQLAQAEAALTQARDALAQRERASGEDIELLRLQSAQAQTQLEQARKALADTEIKAPFAGEISEMLTEEGEFVATGSPVFRLVSTNRQLATFRVPPEDARRLRNQGEIFIRYAGLDYGAYIVRSSDVPGASGLVEITAELYPSEQRIPTGATAQLTYALELAQGPLIPSGAIRTSSGESAVFIIEDGRAVRTRVRSVAESGGRVVVEGLNSGAQLVFPVPADLRSNTRVEVVEGGTR